MESPKKRSTTTQAIHPPSSSSPAPPTAISRTNSNTLHYQTFPTKPPTGKGRPPSFTTPGSGRASYSSRHSSTVRGGFRDYDDHDGSENPSEYGGGNGDSHGRKNSPKRQLIVLAIISLAEQTALNSISPYLPDMTASFPAVDPDKVGLYVGIIASCFAATQVMTNFYWGRLSDRIGRKPVILMGTFWTAIGFLAFGYVKKFWQAAVVQAFIGMVNGNAGVVSTVLGEITDKDNQSSSFAYLPMVYGLGSILGPVMGGLLAGPPSLAISKNYPYLLPNAISAGILFVDFIISMFYLEESLEQAQELPPLGTRVRNLFVWLWQFTAGTTRPSYLRRKFRSTSPSINHHSHQHQQKHLHPHSSTYPQAHSDHPAPTSRRSSTTLNSAPQLFPSSPSPSPDTAAIEEEFKETLLTTPMLLLLASYFIFNLSNITFSSLYPIFTSTPPPTGRGLSPRQIGVTISFAGLAAIIFQVSAGISTGIQTRWGNKFGFKVAMLAMAVSFFLMPLTGTGKEGKAWLYGSISFVLLLKSVANVIGLTCALLMFTNVSPDKSVLGRINGLAQTLAAGGRAVGPFLSGGLWSLGMKQGGGARAGWMAWGIFGAVATLGYILALGINGNKVEAEGMGDEEQGEGEDECGSENSQVLLDDDEEEEDLRRGRRGAGERERLLSAGSAAGNRGGSGRVKPT